MQPQHEQEFQHQYDPFQQSIKNNIQFIPYFDNNNGTMTSIPSTVTSAPIIPTSDISHTPYSNNIQSDINTATTTSQAIAGATSSSNMAPSSVMQKRACDNCRKLKHKCEKKEGAAKCTNCARSKKDCVVSSPQKRGPKPKDIAATMPSRSTTHNTTNFPISSTQTANTNTSNTSSNTSTPKRSMPKQKYSSFTDTEHNDPNFEMLKLKGTKFHEQYVKNYIKSMDALVRREGKGTNATEFGIIHQIKSGMHKYPDINMHVFHLKVARDKDLEKKIDELSKGTTEQRKQAQQLENQYSTITTTRADHRSVQSIESMSSKAKYKKYLSFGKQ